MAKDPCLISQYVSIVEKCKKLATTAVQCGRPQHLRNTIAWIDAQTKMLESLVVGANVGSDINQQHVKNLNDELFEGTLRNPARMTKGGGASSSLTRGKGKKIARRCGICKQTGHNRKSCTILSQVQYVTQETSDVSDEDGHAPIGTDH